MFLTINDLSPLNDVKQQIKYIDVNQDVDRSDLIETFHILINEILTKEPRLYEYYDFEDRLYDKIYNTFTACYGEEITLFEKFNVNDVLLEARNGLTFFSSPRVKGMVHSLLLNLESIFFLY